MRDVLARQRNRVAGLGIAAGTGRPVMQGKTAETADLDAIAVGQRPAHHFQQRLHGHVDILGLQVALALGEDFDQFRFGHGHGHRGGRQIGGPAEAGPPQYRLLGLVLELLAQQRTELGGAARSVGGRRCLAVLGQGLGRLGFVLGLDRQLQRTALAIHAGELGLDRVADLEPLAGVLDAFLGDVAGGHVAFHAVGQLDHRALGVDFLDRAADLGAARMRRHELAERTLPELLYAPADALPFRVDPHHPAFEVVPLLPPPAASSIPAPLASTSFTAPLTLVPRGCAAMNWLNGSCSSCLTPRLMRSRSGSTASTTASRVSPFFSSRATSSPVEFQLMSDRWIRPSMPPSRPMKMPKSVIDLIWPSTLSPFLWMAAKVSHGLDVTCLMPSEMRRSSSSTSSPMTSSSSPTCTTLDGLTFFLVQDRTRKSTRLTSSH